MYFPCYMAFSKAFGSAADTVITLRPQLIIIAMVFLKSGYFEPFFLSPLFIITELLLAP